MRAAGGLLHRPQYGENAWQRRHGAGADELPREEQG